MTPSTDNWITPMKARDTNADSAAYMSGILVYAVRMSHF